MIYHNPIFDTKAVEEIYTVKDGVTVNYVCSTSKDYGTSAYDIFYRETPHPDYGNRYFGLKYHDYTGYHIITNTDWIEELTFDTIECDGIVYYSKHRHDFVQTNVGFIDGGRAYTRVGGNPIPKVTPYKVINGNMEKM